MNHGHNGYTTKPYPELGIKCRKKFAWEAQKTSITSAVPQSDFPVARPNFRASLSVMTKLVEIQEAILHLDHEEQEKLRIWMYEAPLDLEEDSPELEAELLKAVQGPHSLLVKAELEAVAKKALSEIQARSSA